MPTPTLPHRPSWWHRLRRLGSCVPHTKPELLAMLKGALHHGLLDADALAMIEGALTMAQAQARDIMIPRSQMVVVELNQAPAEFLPIVVNSAHSRFPVLGEDQDDVVGILLAKELLKQWASFPDQPLRLTKSLLRPAVFVPESKRLDAILRELRSSHNHLAIVLNEYGGVAGMLTIEDVLEEIVGEIEDEYDSADEPVIAQQAAGVFTVNALTPLTDFNRHFKTHCHGDNIDTIGGWLTLQLGHIPKQGETLTHEALTLTVSHSDRRRVKTLQVSVCTTDGHDDTVIPRLDRGTHPEPRRSKIENPHA